MRQDIRDLCVRIRCSTRSWPERTPFRADRFEANSPPQRLLNATRGTLRVTTCLWYARDGRARDRFCSVNPIITGRRSARELCPRQDAFCAAGGDGWCCDFCHVGCRLRNAISPAGASDLLPQKRNMHLWGHLFNTDSIIRLSVARKAARRRWVMDPVVAACATAGRMSHIGPYHRRGTCPWHSAS